MQISEDKTCYLTTLPATDIDIQAGKRVSYFVKLAGENRHFVFPAEVETWMDEFQQYRDFDKLGERLKAGEWFEDTSLEKGMITPAVLKEFLWGKDYPKTPQQKLDDLFLRIIKCQHIEGQLMDLVNKTSKEYVVFDFPYYLTLEELKFYLGVLIEQEYLDVEPGMNLKEFFRINKFRPMPRFTVSYSGLNHAIALTESGELSSNAFVAMAFAPQYRSIYDQGIYPACRNTGFSPLRMDDEHLESDRTINDSIIALIKRSQFLIADFTGGSSGVYTEAGVGIGRGMKVIYTCRDDWFDKIHFDLNNFPFIKYTDDEMLRRKLEDKINAWVKD